jgi:hypothetical protein
MNERKTGAVSGDFSRIVRGIFAHGPEFREIWGKNCRKWPRNGHLREKRADGIICAKNKSNRVDTAEKGYYSAGSLAQTTNKEYETT